MKNERLFVTNVSVEKVIKISMALVTFWNAACGVRINDDIVIGTTEFLRTAREPQALEQHSDTDRTQLTKLINK